MALPPHLELSDLWVEGRPGLRGCSTVTTERPQAVAPGSSLLEVDPACALPRHTDGAAETVVVVAECVPHQVANAGNEMLRSVERQTSG